MSKPLDELLSLLQLEKLEEDFTVAPARIWVFLKFTVDK